VRTSRSFWHLRRISARPSTIIAQQERVFSAKPPPSIAGPQPAALARRCACPLLRTRNRTFVLGVPTSLRSDPWLLAVPLRVNTHARPSCKIFQMWQMQELPQPEVHKRRCVKPTTNGDSAPLVTVTKVVREDICHAGDGSGASLLQARIARTPHTADVYIPLHRPSHHH